MSDPKPICPLCAHRDCRHYHRDTFRNYLQCPHCQLVFVEPSARLSAAQEKAIYDQHQNDPDDPGYRKFLSRLSIPLLARVPAGAQGLDFGCGPGPTLSVMLNEAGCRVANYDPFYAHQPQLLQQQYDFISCTEVIEHCHQPANEWPLLLKMLKPGGHLAIMTKLVRDPQAFAGWHYKNDQTHVSFFSRATFRFLAERDQLAIEFIGNDVIMMQKPL